MQREIKLGYTETGSPEFGSLKTDLQAQINNFTVMEIRNLITHDVIDDPKRYYIHRHIREIEPRDRITFILFCIQPDDERIIGAEVVFQLESGDYEVKIKREDLVKDLAITVEFH